MSHPGGIVADGGGKRAALAMGPGGPEISYELLDKQANRLSRYLAQSGLAPGAHVAFAIRNQLEFFVVMWACHYAGLLYTALNPNFTERELGHIVSDCRAELVILAGDVAEKCPDLRRAEPRVRRWLSLGRRVPGFRLLEEELTATPFIPLSDRWEGDDMLYTSGTTGIPKGVQIERARARLGETDGGRGFVTRYYGATCDTVFLLTGPLYHAGSLRYGRTMLRLGAKVVVMERFTAEQFLSAVERHGVTMALMVPAMFHRILDFGREAVQKFQTSSLTAVVHGSAACSPDVKHAMIDLFGPIFHEFYSGTEGNGFVYCSNEEWLLRPGTVGRATDGILHVLNGEGNDLPPGSIGDIYFEDPHPFSYFGSPEKTATVKDGQGRGWTTLGDVGYLEGDGYLYLTDRTGFTINRGGLNIYPKEIENVLCMHPAVEDAAVVGGPHDSLGEGVVAFVVMKEGFAEEDSVLSEKLTRHCRHLLSREKCPEVITILAALPLDENGKVQKARLREPLWRERGRQI